MERSGQAIGGGERQCLGDWGSVLGPVEDSPEPGDSVSLFGRRQLRVRWLAMMMPSVPGFRFGQCRTRLHHISYKPSQSIKSKKIKCLPMPTPPPPALADHRSFSPSVRTFRGSADASGSTFTRRARSVDTQSLERLSKLRQPAKMELNTQKMELNTQEMETSRLAAWSAKGQQLDRRGWGAADKPSQPRLVGCQSRSNDRKAKDSTIHDGHVRCN